MDNNTEKSLAGTKFSRLAQILGTLEKRYYEQNPDGDVMDLDISFEFLIGSLYPHVYQNVQKAITDAYMQGYLQGKEDAEGHNEN